MTNKTEEVVFKVIDVSMAILIVSLSIMVATLCGYVIIELISLGLH